MSDTEPEPIDVHLGPPEVVEAVKAIHDEPDDEKSLDMERALLQETSKGDEDEGVEDDD